MYTIYDVIDEYLNRGFGSMTKNDFEVWIFHQLLQNQLKDKSNYEISRRLKIPESKVKRLRYEADLKFVDEKESEERRKQELNRLLEKAVVKRSGTLIQFVVEDPALRKYLDYKLKQKNTFSDSSFNSEIVSISIDDYEILLEMSDISGKEIKQLLDAAKKKLNDKSLTLKGLLQILIKGFTEGLGQGLGGLSITGLFNLLSAMPM